MSLNSSNMIIGIGEALWDVLPQGAKLGGAPANFAYHAGQFGLKSMAVSALGQDELGEKTKKEFESRLDIYMERVPYPTGTVQVTLDCAGVPQYDIKEGVAWDNIPWTPRLKELSQNCTAVCFGSLAQRNAVSRNTINLFLDNMPDTSQSLKIFDINLRQHFYSKDLVVSSLNKCNVLKINDEELDIVSKMFGIEDLSVKDRCRRLIRDYNLKYLILTCGVNGSYIFDHDNVSSKDTPKVIVADTVGAGDSFAGAFCAGILKGLPLERVHELAVQVSAFVCTQAGAMPPLSERLLRMIYE